MAVSGVPDVTKTAITYDTQFIICACDGIWDCMTSQQAVDFVNKGKIKLQDMMLKSPTKAKEELKVTKQNSSGNKYAKPAGHL